MNLLHGSLTLQWALKNIFGIDDTKSKKILDEATAFLKSKRSTEIDNEEIRSIKGLIGRCEVRVTCKYAGRHFYSANAAWIHLT